MNHLKTFLPSVVETRYPDYEIILADNASTDGSVEWVSEQFPSVKIASFDDNYGYTGGNNRAVPFGEKEILIFLNNDVQVDPNWLTGLNQLFESDADIGAAQPKILSYKEPEYFEYAGAAGGFLDRLGYPFCRGRLLDIVEKDLGQYEAEIELSWASGAALAIKKNLFDELGGFDEDFEFHMEEIDLCWRLKNIGYKIGYSSQSRVFHLGGGSLPMGTPRKVYYNFRNNLYMLWKNLPSSQLLTKIIIRLALDQIAAVRSLISGRPKEFISIIKAHLHFIFGLSKIHRKRKNIQRKADSDALSPVFLVWQYFIKGKKKYPELF